MAEDKKSFVLYTDSHSLIRQLPDDVAGKLLKHIFSYVNDENPISDDLLLNVAFEPIKNQLKRDLKKYELIKEKRSIAGKKSAELRKQNTTNSTSVDCVQQTSTNSTVSDSVNVSVSDSVSVINKKESIDARKLKFSSTLAPFLEMYGKDLLNDFYRYWTEPNRSGTKFRQETEKTWSLDRRLETWAKNDKNFSEKTQNGKQNSTAGTKKAYSFDASRIIETNTR